MKNRVDVKMMYVKSISRSYAQFSLSFYHLIKGNLDVDRMTKLLARITPILDVSDQCLEESMFYLDNLVNNTDHPLWAIKRKCVK